MNSGSASERIAFETSRFEDLARHLAAVWKYRLVPAVDDVRSLATEGDVLLEDGTKVTLRRLPHPALSFDTANRLVERFKTAGVTSDEGEDWERVIREFVGDQWFEELVEEGEQVREWHVAIAELTAKRLVLTGFVALNHLLESWFVALCRNLGILPDKWNSRADLKRPIARVLDLNHLDDLNAPGQAIEDMLRRVANDVKHNDGVARQSAVGLDVTPGTDLPLNVADLAVWTGEIVNYVRALSGALLSKAGG